MNINLFIKLTKLEKDLNIIFNVLLIIIFNEYIFLSYVYYKYCIHIVVKETCKIWSYVWFLVCRIGSMSDNRNYFIIEYIIE